MDSKWNLTWKSIMINVDTKKIKDVSSVFGDGVYGIYHLPGLN